MRSLSYYEDPDEKKIIICGDLFDRGEEAEELQGYILGLMEKDEVIGGFSHSDTVLVTKDGYEILTHYPTDLESLIVKDARILDQAKGAVIRKVINVD